MKSNTWNYQYLEDEKLHYLTEVHPEDGILGELFFEGANEFLDYIEENDIDVYAQIDAELVFTQLLNENLKIEYDKEHGEGAYDNMIKETWLEIINKINKNE